MKNRFCPDCGKPLPADGLMGLCPACLLATGAAATGAEAGAGRRFVPPAPGELRFEQLEILELLGSGGMGAVYKARQPELDRIVALKILPPDIGADPAFAERFTREARALAKLTHPHIVTLHDFGRTPEGLYYFFMEYVDGMNLRQLLAGGRLSPGEALAIVPPVCEALQYAHDRGVVHRDIKPENILLGRDGQVKIADFGVARLFAGETPEAETGGPAPGLTEAGRVLGTPRYMAPEQASNPLEVDHRADIYSLGVVFYQMLTGELPGEGGIERPSSKVRIDVRLDEVVLRALEADPERRYQHASVFQTQVETVASALSPSPSSPGSPPAPSTSPTSPEGAGFWRRVAAGGLDILLVTLGLFPLVLLIAWAAPGRIVVEVPFGLFTRETVLDTQRFEEEHEDGSRSLVERKIVEVRPLNHWRYVYFEDVRRVAGQEVRSRELVEPMWAVRATSAGGFTLWVLLIYWSLMESSPWQASVGKRLMGIRVGDLRGRRLGFFRALGRNGAKAFSLIPFGLGFFMAGWTQRRQALHDLMAAAWLAKDPLPVVAEPAGRWRTFGVPLTVGTLALLLPMLNPEISRRNVETVRNGEQARLEKKLQEGRRRMDESAPPVLPDLFISLEKEEPPAVVERFIGVPWGTVPLFAAGSPLNLSEKELAALPATERERVSGEFSKATRSMRTLVDFALAIGQQEQAMGNGERAAACFEAVRRFGRALDRPDTPVLFRFFGQATEKAGRFRLEKLKGETPDAAQEAGHPKLPEPREGKSRFQIRRVTPDPAEEADPFPYGGGTLRLAKPVYLNERDFSGAAAVEEEGGSVKLLFTPEGQQRFKALTTATVGKAIACVLDGKILTAPRVNEPIGGSMMVISGANAADLVPAFNKAVADAGPEPAAVTTPPELSLLRWYQGDEANNPWPPEGVPAGMPPPAGLDLNPGPGEAPPRMLTLWFSHPLFEWWSFERISVLEADGTTPFTRSRFDFNVNRLPAKGKEPGWIIATLNLGDAEALPEAIVVLLRYGVGPWKVEAEVPADFRGVQTLAPGVLTQSPGEGADGQAFIQIARGAGSHPPERQTRVQAILKDGSRLDAVSIQYGSVAGTTTGQFTFRASLAEVRAFEYATRPLRSFRETLTLRPHLRKGRHFVFDRQGETMADLVERLRSEHRLRLHFEDLDFDPKTDAETLGEALRILGAKEKAGTLAAPERERLLSLRSAKKERSLPEETLIHYTRLRYDGTIEADSVDELLARLTEGTPYDFRKNGETSRAIVPRGYSRLAYPVTLDATGMSVEEAAQAILSQHPGPGTISPAPFVISGPWTAGTDYFPWRSVRPPALKLEGVSAMEALCRITETARPDSLWQLGGYKTGRHLSVLRGTGWEHEVIAQAQAWLAAIDAGRENHNDAAAFFRKQVSREQWEAALSLSRRPLGEARRRSLRAIGEHRSLPGVPDGRYLVMQFESVFARKETAMETVTFMREADGVWRAAGYFIQ